MNAYSHYDDTQTKRAQIIYLKYVKEETNEFIAELTGYAVSTVRNYANKFFELLESAKELFKGSRKTKIQKSRVEDNHFVINENTEIFVECDTKNFYSDSEKFYLIRAFDENGKRLFSKVGTTTRDILTRMKEHLKSYKDLGVVKIIIDRVWNCGNTPAEGFESFFRAIYISKFAKHFKKNDRFFDIDFNLNEADEIYTQYAGMTA